jgi:hypothetical protein
VVSVVLAPLYMQRRKSAGQRVKDQRFRRKLAVAQSSEWNDKCALVGTISRESKAPLDAQECQDSEADSKVVKPFERAMPMPPTDCREIGPLFRDFFNRFLPAHHAKIKEHIESMHCIARKRHAWAFRALANAVKSPLIVRLVGEYCVDYDSGMTLLQQALYNEYRVPLVCDLLGTFPERLRGAVFEIGRYEAPRQMSETTLGAEYQHFQQTPDVFSWTFHEQCWLWVQQVGAWPWLSDRREQIAGDYLASRWFR